MWVKDIYMYACDLPDLDSSSESELSIITHLVFSMVTPFGALLKL